MKSLQQSALILASALSLIVLLRWLDSRIQRRVLCIDPLLALRGSGRHIWAGRHAEDFVRSLREGWE